MIYFNDSSNEWFRLAKVTEKTNRTNTVTVPMQTFVCISPFFLFYRLVRRFVIDRDDGKIMKKTCLRATIDRKKSLRSSKIGFSISPKTFQNKQINIKFCYYPKKEEIGNAISNFTKKGISDWCLRKY